MPSSVPVHRSSPLDLAPNTLFPRKAADTTTSTATITTSADTSITSNMTMAEQYQHNQGQQQLNHQYRHHHHQEFQVTVKNESFNNFEYRNSQYDRHLDQKQGYRSNRQLLEEDIDDDDEDEGDDIEDDEDDDNFGYQSTYHSAYNTAHNSAYNSCDESDDVNMEGVSLKENNRDQDMTEPPSSSTSSSSSTARFPFTPSHNFQPHYPQSQPQQHAFQLQRQQTHELSSLAPSSSSSSTTTPSASSKPSPSTQTPLAIKPRPALRPLLPSRPTSPQSVNLNRSGSHSSEMDVSKDPSAKTSSSTTFTNSKSGLSGSTGKTRQSAYKINGLNILNRNSLDSRTALEMIRRRRENHNHVERRRRDTLNSTILQIADILPNCSSTAKLNKGTILRLALDHLRALHTENHSLRSENAALRFFYQGSQMRRNGPTQGSTGAPNHGQPNSGPAHPQNPHSFTRGNTSSGMSTPPIIPGSGQGSIPSLTGSNSQLGANMAMASAPGSTPGSAPGSVANSPPGQHSAYLRSSPVPPSSSSFMPVTPTIKRSQSTSGHLHPILPKSQAAKVSPSSSPRPRLLPHPSPNGIKPYSDAIRIGPSPLSSPCSSPPLAPMVPHYPGSSNPSTLANALPTVPASHQHSAAVSAAAAAAAAAAATAGSGSSSNGSGSSGNNRSLMPSSASSSMANRHQKSSSSGSQPSGHNSYTPLQPHGPGMVPDKSRKFSAHSTHSSITSASSSGTPSATTSPYSSPYPGTGYSQGGQGQSHNSSPSFHPSFQQGHSSSNQHQYQHHQHHHAQGSGITLPSIGSVTTPSSPMTSPHHGPYQMGSLPLPTPMSLPAPAIGQDSFVKQHPNASQSASHGSVPHPHHPHAHPHEGFPILPPLVSR
ncbi:hypothetical protein BGX27_009556 [Mortierella sp. AM989]|nr:hypothetical protein BGX27_009556 [Mortierella sp. AM989]